MTKLRFRPLLTVTTMTHFTMAACGSVTLGEPALPTSTQQLASTQLSGNVDHIGKLSGQPGSALDLYVVMSSVGALAVDTSGRISGLTDAVVPTSAYDPGCITGTAELGFTYNNCTTGPASINGTVRITPTTAAINLSVKSSVVSAAAEITLAGTLARSNTSLKGSMTYELKVSLAGVSLDGLTGGAGTYKTTVLYDITFSGTPACVSGGTIRIDQESGPIRGAAQFEYSGCNQYKVRNG